MFWTKIRSKEYNLLEEHIRELGMKISILEIDITLLTDRLSKAIGRKAIKKIEETEGEEKEKNNNPQILPV